MFNIRSKCALKAALTAMLFSALLSPLPATAQDPSAYTDDPAAKGDTPESIKGYEIAARSDRSDAGFGDSKVSAMMMLRNSAGQTTERSLSFSTLEKEDETVGDKSLVIFNSSRC